MFCGNCCSPKRNLPSKKKSIWSLQFFDPLKHVTLDHVDLAAHAQEMWLFSSVAAMIGSVAQGGLYDFDRVDGTGWFCQFVLRANPLKQQLVVWDTFPTLSLNQATTVQPMPSWTLSVHDDVPSSCQPSPCNGGLGLKLVWLHVPEHRKAGSHMAEKLRSVKLLLMILMYLYLLGSFLIRLSRISSKSIHQFRGLILQRWGRADSLARSYITGRGKFISLTGVFGIRNFAKSANP